VPQLLCGLSPTGEASDGILAPRGVTLEEWVRLAPNMGLADVITADSTFEQLASHDADETRCISAEVLARYCERILAKASPGAALIGGVMKSTSAASLLDGVKLSDDEQVLTAGTHCQFPRTRVVRCPRAWRC
jgi:hypothetical protein